MRRLFGSMLLALVLACGGGSDREAEDTLDNLETEDVGDAFDAGLSTEEDTKGRLRKDPEIAGVLPGGFPTDVPLFKPSSIVDFGELDAGRYYLELDTSAPASAVSAELESSLAGFGWAKDGGGALTKGGRSLRLVVNDLSPGTRIRYEY